MYVFHTSLVIL